VTVEEPKEPVTEPVDEPVEPVTEPEEEQLTVDEPVVTVEEPEEPVIEPVVEPEEPDDEPEVSDEEEQLTVDEPEVSDEDEQVLVTEPVIELEEEQLTVEEPEVSDEEDQMSVTGPEEPVIETESAKPKRVMPESQKRAMKIGRVQVALFKENKWAEVEAEFEDELNDKDLKKAVDKKLKKMYDDLSNEVKEEWKKEAIDVIDNTNEEEPTSPPKTTKKATPTPKKTTKKATPPPPTDSEDNTETSAKPKREVSDEKKVAMALGRKAKALFNNEKRAEVEAQFPDLDKKAVNKKLTDMYHKDKKTWMDRAREAGVSDTEVFCPNNEE